MGWKVSQVTPQIVRLMNPADQAYYSPGIHPSYEEDHHPPPKTDVPETAIQRGFATDCLEHGWRYVWHGTHKRSTANVGCPDFIVAAYSMTFWIEFKKGGEDLSPDQKVFKRQLEANGVMMYVCFTAAEAVQLIEQYSEAVL